jgi:hypothetical protein
MSAPVGLGAQITTFAPTITSGRNSKRFARREMVLSTLLCRDAFVIQNTIRVNPGLAASFPWLSTEAVGWTQYKIHRLSAIFISSCASSQGGDVYLTPVYDPTQPAPQTEQQVSSYEGTKLTNVWTHLEMDLDARSMMGIGPRKYVRSGLSAGDLKTYDACNIVVSTVNGTTSGHGNAVVGKLYLDYDIEFFDPVIQTPSAMAPASTYVIRAAPGALTSDVPFAVNTWDTVLFPDPLGVTITASNSVFLLPVGIYRVTMRASFLSNVSPVPTSFQLNSFQGGSLIDSVANGYAVYSGGAGLTSNATLNTAFIVAVTDSASQGIGFVVLASSATTTSLILTEAYLLITPA